MKTPVTHRLAVGCALMILAGALPARADQPEKSIGIDNSLSVNYGARVRLTRTTWDYLKFTLRDTFKQWGANGGEGFNLLLDSGYDQVAKSGGPVRTTPVEYYWAFERGNSECTWGDCGVSSANSGGVPTRRKNGQWLQVRKPDPACNLNETVNGNQRGIPDATRAALHREHGFYVSDGDLCYKEYNVCTTGGDADYSTPHQYLEPGNTVVCDTAPILALGVATVRFNLGLFIFPNWEQENAQGGVDSWAPTSRWGYTGIPGLHGARSSGTISARSESCDWDGSCQGSWSTQGRWYAANAPANAGVYNPANQYSKTDGTYFRAGDDTALYFNIFQTQVQGIDRDSVSVAPAGYKNDCGLGLVYNGTVVSGEPQYFSAAVPQCVRPKMYWDGVAMRWTQCDPFDTYNIDGTLNPNRDDARTIYPGRVGVDGTCGAANDAFNTANWNSGWYGFKLNYLNVIPNTHADPNRRNSVELELEGRDLRIEVGLWLDAVGSAGVTVNIRRERYIGRIGIDFLRIRGRLKLISVDDTSCNLAVPETCSDPFTGANDGKLDPDKLQIVIELNKDTDIDLVWRTPAWLGSNDCVLDITLVGCVLTIEDVVEMAKDALSTAIKGVIGPVLIDTLQEFTGAIPQLNDALGDPIVLNNVVIDPGIYAVGAPGTGVAVGNTTRYPVRMFSGPGANQEITDLRMSIGFDPIAFRPPNPAKSNIMEPDTTPHIAKTPPSFFAVPTLKEPDTSGCINATGTGYTYNKVSGASYAYNNMTGWLSSLPANTAINTAVGAMFIDVSTGAMEEVTERNTGNNTIRVRRYAVSGLNGGAFETTSGIVSGIAFSSGGLATIGVGQLFVDISTGQESKITAVNAGGGTLTIRKAISSQFNGGSFRLHNCSRQNTYPQLDPDASVDADDYVVYGSYTDPIRNQVFNAPSRLPEYWMPPYTEAPSWCVRPHELKSNATGAFLDSLYPRTTWLSFSGTHDYNPSGALVPQNTFGNWDTMKPNTILRQNRNTGELDTSALSYDLSIHIHQRVLAEFVQVLMASGAACLEFGPRNTDGTESPWKSMLATESFAAFIPELVTFFPGRYVSVRMTPTKTPHVRTGVGNLSFVPTERMKDPIGGPLPIMNQQYTLSAAVPEIRIDVVIDDPVAPENAINVFTMYWNVVAGFYVKGVRQCYKLDPLVNDPQCTSSLTNVRTVSGYYEMFLDVNSPSLQQAWENPRDGFAIGQFSNPGIGDAPGSAAVVINKSYCNNGVNCDVIGLSQAVPTLMTSLIQMFMVARVSFYNFTIDALYIGPDGPNDDLVGGGDYLGVYARMLGNLDVFGLIGAIGTLAPGQTLLPQAQVPDLETAYWHNTRKPIFNVALTSQRNVPADSVVDSYTYRIDEGFWRTPTDVPIIEAGPLLEGEHTLEIRTLADTLYGASAQLVPTKFAFRVDTVPPAVSIKQHRFFDRIDVQATDLQTAPELIRYEYKLNQGEWQEADGPSISLSRASPGRHTVRVKATDLAGNATVVAKEVTLDGSGCGGCASGGAGDALIWLAFGLLAAYRLSRRRV